jgi:putative CocE/NonD family hydrolase
LGSFVRSRLIFVLISLPLAASAAVASANKTAPVISQYNLRVPMRDGVLLSANVFRPSGVAAAGVTAERYPAILLRTPYGKGDALTPAYQSFVNRGYVVVVEDVRGRYQSGGTFEPINQETADGDDTLNWIARQPWSDGGVGMYGGSYLGIAQWKAAMTHNPHLKAIFPYVSGDDDYRDRFYSTGGAMKIGHRLLWFAENMRAAKFAPPDFKSYVQALPLRAADVAATGHSLDAWQKVADHPSYDDFWKAASVREHLKDIHIPVYSVGGWYDNFVESDLDAFSIRRKHNPDDRIMIGPWAHVFSAAFPKVNFGKNALVPLRPEQLRWFDRWLKDSSQPEKAPPVRIFVMGINQWRDEEEWPLVRARGVKYYLGPDGQLGSKPDAHSAPDSFIYDPRNPVPTMGGAVCCDPRVFPWGPLDQRPVEKRRDVLVYSTAPLASAVEVTGPVKVVLRVASNAPDTDFTAKLVDVFPDGNARNLTDGILRMRYRDSLETPKLMTPGEVYKVTIDAGVTSNVFLAGHRIRLEISSSNFPRFDRNPNTGGPVADAGARDIRRAIQTVYHEHERYSYALLPVVSFVGSSAPAQLTSNRQAGYVPKRGSETPN